MAETTYTTIQIRRLIIILLVLIAIVLFIGTLGFHYISKHSWLDSFHNSAMYLAGLGPLFPMETTGQKLFSTFYAIIASIFFLAIIIFFVDRVLALEIV